VLLTVIQAAQRAGVSRHTIASCMTQGRLPVVLLERPHIRPADLAAVQARAHAGAVVPACRQDLLHAGMRPRAAGPNAVGQGRPAAADR
jgi:hypothetical protein